MNTKENEAIVKMSNILKAMGSFTFMANSNLLSKSITEELGGELSFTYKANGSRLIYKLEINDQSKALPFFDSIFSEYGCSPDIFITTPTSPEQYYDPGYDYINDLNPVTISRLILTVCKEINEDYSEWNLWVQYIYDAMKNHHKIISDMVSNNEKVINSITTNNNPDLF